VCPLLWNEEFSQGDKSPKAPAVQRIYHSERSSMKHCSLFGVRLYAWQLWGLVDEEAEGRPREGMGSAQLAWTFVLLKLLNGFL
jgi:hypothetical protein